MEKHSLDPTLFTDSELSGELPSTRSANASPGFLREAIARSTGATEPYIATWMQAEKTGIQPLNENQIAQFYNYVRSCLKPESDLVQRADLLIRERVADPDRITQDVQQVYANRGIGRTRAAKVSEQKRDEKIMRVAARPVLDKLERELEDTVVPLAQTDRLIGTVIPDLLDASTHSKEYEPSERLRVKILPTLSRSQGRALLAQFDEPTNEIILPGYADMVKGSALPDLIRPDVSALTLKLAMQRQDGNFMWAALIGARTMYSAWYNRLFWLHHMTLISYSGSITAEAKQRQVEQWRAAHTGHRQTAISFTAKEAAAYVARRSVPRPITPEQLAWLEEERPIPESYDTHGTLWEIRRQDD